MDTKGSCASGTCPKNACHCKYPVVQRLLGKWREQSVENLEPFAKELGLNMKDKSMGDLTKFHEEWSLNGDKVTLKVRNPFLSTSTTFKLDEPVNEDTYDARNAKTIYTEEGGKLVCRQEREPQNIIYMREIKTDGLLKLTMKIEDEKSVICTVYFTQETLG